MDPQGQRGSPPRISPKPFLRITIPKGARLIGFADDVAIVVTDKKLPDAERICNEAGKRAWVDSKGLALAAHKTEAVLVSSRQKVETAIIKIAKATFKSVLSPFLGSRFPKGHDSLASRMT